MFLCQEKYSKELLSKFGMEECNSAATPLEMGVKFFENLGDLDEAAGLKGVGYKSAVGSLLYLTSGTLPDLAAGVHTLC